MITLRQLQQMALEALRRWDAFHRETPRHLRAEQDPPPRCVAYKGVVVFASPPKHNGDQPRYKYVINSKVVHEDAARSHLEGHRR